MRVLLIVLLSLPCHAQRNWEVFTPRAQTYVGSREAGYQSKYSASLRSTPRASQTTYGLYVQDLRTSAYRGCRLRLSGYLRTQIENGWAGLWLRADRGKKPLAFDNMQSRPVRSKTDWNRYQIEVDIPADADSLHYGALLNGLGQMWVDDLKLEIVGTPPPGLIELRKLRTLQEPSNLGFEE
jgi:hypothetical protein